MNITALTTYDMLTDSLTKGMQAAFTLAALAWIIGLFILIGTVALITWVVKKVWYAGSNREYKRQQREWKKVQKQEAIQERKNQKAIKASNRIQNQGYVKDGQLFSPTGWRWDEDAKLWVPPKNLK